MLANHIICISYSDTDFERDIQIQDDFVKGSLRFKCMLLFVNLHIVRGPDYAREKRGGVVVVSI